MKDFLTATHLIEFKKRKFDAFIARNNLIEIQEAVTRILSQQ